VGVVPVDAGVAIRVELLHDALDFLGEEGALLVEEARLCGHV
jgi:hypothetical protein